LNRLIAPILSLILILGVGYLIFTSVGQQLGGPVKLRGAIGSEKAEFFKDPELQSILRGKGFEVEVVTAGSRSMATTFDLTGFDFAFPAGSPAAQKLRRDKKVSASFDVFFSPMVIATWKPISAILKASGVSSDKGKYDELGVAAFLELVKAQKRWSDLKGNAEYDVSKPVLISTTDVRSSNSAAMFLALVSYVLNGNNVVQDAAQAAKITPLVAPLFRQQGYQEASSAGPFEDYLLIGIGKSPMVFIYESQFLERVVKKSLRPEMRLMYPSPTVFTKHILVPLTENGTKLGELLTNDPGIQKIAAKYGFRPNNPDIFSATVSQYGLPIKTNIVNVIDPPNFETLENMIRTLETK
jgi:Bacterial extracellular solute-binding protein